MHSSSPSPDTGEQLVLAGIADIEAHGLQNFSMRRVAAACHLSCAAPYKHYKNKNDFLVAIIQYIHKQWSFLQADVMAKHRGSRTRDLLADISLAYVKFLVQHPNFRSILLMRDEEMSPEAVREKTAVSEPTRALIRRYCEEVRMEEKDAIRKTFIVRSLIYGAALLMDCGELPKDETHFLMVRDSIQREFDLT